jgi:hydroxymethylpyrimidine pyrophosphatase-like HAD family hydrolase
VAEHLLKELELSDPCIIAGGAQIIDPHTWELIWQAPIPAGSLSHIAQSATNHGYEVAYSRGLITKADQPPADLRGNDIDVVYILGVPTAEVEALTNSLATDPNIAAALADSWRLAGAGMDFHITSKYATKEHAVHELAKIINIPASRMAGVGDGPNDIHLFNAVGYKVAMGNAVPELKAAADEVVGSIHEDGLAKYIQRLLS